MLFCYLQNTGDVTFQTVMSSHRSVIFTTVKEYNCDPFVMAILPFKRGTMEIALFPSLVFFIIDLLFLFSLLSFILLFSQRENWMRIIEYFRKNSRINITMDQVARVSKAYANAIRPILLILHQYFVLKRDGPKKHRNTPKQQNYPRTTIGALEKNSLKIHAQITVVSD